MIKMFSKLAPISKAYKYKSIQKKYYSSNKNNIENNNMKNFNNNKLTNLDYFKILMKDEYYRNLYITNVFNVEHYERQIHYKTGSVDEINYMIKHIFPLHEQETFDSINEKFNKLENIYNKFSNCCICNEYIEFETRVEIDLIIKNYISILKNYDYILTTNQLKIIKNIEKQMPYYILNRTLPDYIL